MCLGISKTTKADPLAWKHTFSYSRLWARQYITVDKDATQQGHVSDTCQLGRMLRKQTLVIKHSIY